MSLYYCLFEPHILYMSVVLCAHPVCGESHIQRNANTEVATILSLCVLTNKINQPIQLISQKLTANSELLIIGIYQNACKITKQSITHLFTPYDSEVRGGKECDWHEVCLVRLDHCCFLHKERSNIVIVQM